ncbi:hypothetical protein [Kitasatospora sp. McL0602]|uniref:hypothetical protein n=1 Tax=Kitasatospora sp. McL0602 TaxID=3439530 RepID=UPI003F89DA43
MFAALPAAATSVPTVAVSTSAPARAAQPVLVTDHVSAMLSTLSAAPGESVDITLTMTVPPEGLPQSDDIRTAGVLSLKADSGLWDFTDGCVVLSGPAPTGCSTGYAAQVANWFGGGIKESGVLQLLFRSTVALDAEPGAYDLLLRGTPGTLPQERAAAQGVFTVLDADADQTKRQTAPRATGSPVSSDRSLR